MQLILAGSSLFILVLLTNSQTSQGYLRQGLFDDNHQQTHLAPVRQLQENQTNEGMVGTDNIPTTPLLTIPTPDGDPLSQINNEIQHHLAETASLEVERSRLEIQFINAQEKLFEIQTQLEAKTALI